VEAKKSVRKSPKGERRREDIVRSATRLFSRYGYERVRIADIAKEVGISDAGVLYHFPTKEALFTAIVDLRERDYRLDMADADSVREMLDRSIESVQQAATHPDLLRLRVTLTGIDVAEDTPVRGRLARNFALMLPPAEKTIRKGIAAGEIRANVDPQHAALTMYAINEGVRSQWVLASSLHYEMSYVRTYADGVNMLYRGIAERPLPSRIDVGSIE
jgi:AcrR family transcriptional regulator